VAEAAWKPWVAGLLVVGAIAMIGRNVAGPLLNRESATESALGSPTSQPSSEEPAATSPDVSGSIPTSIDTSRLSGWIEECDRDPFVTRVGRGRSHESTDARILYRTTRPTKFAGVRVSAIAWGHDRMALVDGMAVRVGDSLPEGVLVGIFPDRLALESPEGDTILRFREGRTP
jgi:hypothetical protein